MSPPSPSYSSVVVGYSSIQGIDIRRASAAKESDAAYSRSTHPAMDPFGLPGRTDRAESVDQCLDPFESVLDPPEPAPDLVPFCSVDVFEDPVERATGSSAFLNA